MNAPDSAIDFERLKISWWMKLVLRFVPSETIESDEGTFFTVKKFRAVLYIVGERS